LAIVTAVESISTCGDNRLFCLFCSARLASNITRFCSYFYQYRHDINKNMIPLAPLSQEGMGEAFLAPQGAAPAPPSQKGMADASLAPQGAPPAPTINNINMSQ